MSAAVDPEVEVLRSVCRRLTNLGDIEIMERRIAHLLSQKVGPAPERAVSS